MKRLGKKLTYANVMSSLAVFLVLGGATAFAATQLGKNSVGAAQLKAGAVTATKIHAHAVTGGKIADGTITGSDIASGSVTGSNIKLDTLPVVPKAERVAGQESFSFFAPEPVEKVVARVGPFRLIAGCQGGLHHTSFLALTSENDGATATKVGSVDPGFRLGPHIGGVGVLADDGSKPGILTDGAEWFATDLEGSGGSVSISHLALGLDVDGHPGECFFAGTLEALTS